MAAVAPELPANSGESFGRDLAGMGNFLIDPAKAALRVHSKWFWLGPLILFAVISLIASYLMIPMTQHVMEVAPIPAGTSPEQYEKTISMVLRFQRISMYFAPIMVAIIFALQALVLLGVSSMMSVGATFRQLFNLVAGCSLIQVLSSIAALLIVKAKGQVANVAELRPALGLDIFLPAGANKFLAAFLGYFSVFEIWWIVMMVLIFSIAFRVTKGKAFAVILPLIFLSILLRLAGALGPR